jgi:Xaa-Pro aminopeptidase
MRRIKTEEEIAALRGASEAAAQAMVEAMRATQPGRTEWEIEALMDLVHRRAGATGPAYQAIVGSGPNSLVLHYRANVRTLQDGDVLLIDYGPELRHYVADVTRTWPVSGKFTPRQAELYDAVLRAQEAGIAAAKPGNSISDVEAACREVLRESGFSRFVRHGSCHLVGMEVHDPFDPRTFQAPLQPGTVFTIEPGLYEEETAIGIRIEDTIVITAEGCEVLSRAAPKDRAAIEAIVGRGGALEAIDGARSR